MKLLAVVGARPQFVKAWPLGLALRQAGHHEVLVHTGQHYDRLLSDVFFSELGIPEPAVNLGVGSGGHGWQTGTMLIGLAGVMIEQRPDVVVIFGDTNSTLAGALAACKLGVPLVHVEAGMRSFDRGMPEELNRVVADHCADLLLCPTETAVTNLAREGLGARARLTGDTMYDAVVRCAARARERSRALATLALEPRAYDLLTLHRPANVDDPDRLAELLRGVSALGRQVVWPVHPRAGAGLAALAGGPARHLGAAVRLVEPVGYLDMLALEQQAAIVLTDSGGVQREAYFLGIPCVTLRAQTEWPETLTGGWNVLVPGGGEAIVAAVRGLDERPPSGPRAAFGDGNAASRMVREIEELQSPSAGPSAAQPASR